MNEQYPLVKQRKAEIANQNTSSDSLYSSLVNHIIEKYTICVNRHGTVFIVDTDTMQARFIDDPDIENVFANQFFQHFNKRLPKSIMRDAISAIKGTPEKGLMPKPLCTHIVDSDIRSTIVYRSGKRVQVGPERTNHQSLIPSRRYSGFQHNPPPKYPHHISPAAGEYILKEQDPPGNINRLFEITNLPIRKNLLIITWLVLCLLPHFNLVALEITGFSRSGKSTALKTLRDLIDSKAPTLRNIKKAQQIKPNLLDYHLVCIDGADDLNDEAQQVLADCLHCYTLESTKKKEGQYKVDIKRAVLLSNLESAITNPALHKSTLTIELDTITAPLENPLDSDSRRDALEEIFTGLLNITRSVVKALQTDSPWTPTDPGLNDYCHIGRLVANALDQLHPNTQPATQSIAKHDGEPTSLTAIEITDPSLEITPYDAPPEPQGSEIVIKPRSDKGMLSVCDVVDTNQPLDTQEDEHLPLFVRHSNEERLPMAAANAFDLQWEQYLQERQQLLIDDDAVASAIQEWIHHNPDHLPSVLPTKEWMEELFSYTALVRLWPQTPRKMSARLKVAASLLAPLGITIQHEGKSGSYGYWRIDRRRTPPASE
ncbi:hypothetical protein LRD18_12260 [Halorhodospira halochloris]|uniref:hypothetical protein n=1 Tax=Halorhodospira halochloris TaxID=1052 RepID=UPI001EE790BE|nr:hypothetical protein [Halorhodospira halochloris]MCG5531612.1 hypothetical protein [Halorhodospira halochloris]